MRSLSIPLLSALALGLTVAPLAAQKDKDELPPSREQFRISQTNLKQLGLGMHNYLSDRGTFPANIKSADGKALLSWRVAILPFIEQAELHKQFKLDEPWDSEHNKKLLEKIPKLYAPVRGKAEKGQTFYQCFSGGGAFLDKNPRKITDIVDGTANTIMIVEAAESVPWTKPADIPFDPNKELPKLGGMFDGAFQATFADGSIRGFKKDIKQDLLKALITIAGNEVVQLD